MNCIKFHNRDLLNGLTQKQIEEYLTRNRWLFKNRHSRPDISPSANFSIWWKDDEEIIVPNSERFADRPQRVAEILTTIGIMENKPLCELYEEITQIE